MQTRLKTYYTAADCRMLRRVFVRHMKELANKGLPLCLSLSGGMDSITILYALLEAKVPFTAYTFYFDNVPSSDLVTVQQLHKHLDFPQVYVKIPSKWEDLRNEVKESVNLCKTAYKRIRAVKVETILCYRALKQVQPQEPVLVIDGEQLAFLETKNDAIWISHVGEFSPEVDEARRGKFSDLADVRETDFIFENIAYPFLDDSITDYLCNFAISACNSPKPKAILYYAFEDYHKLCGSYRKPKSFQKACNAKGLFNKIAMQMGYKDALELFKAVDRDER